MLRSVLTCAPHETECGLRTWERDLQVQSAATILFEPLQVVRRHLSTAMPELKCKTWYRWRAREHFNYQTLSKQDLGAASKPSQDACAAHQTRSRMQATPAPARQPRPSRTLNLSKSRKVLGAATGALERSTVARQCREVMLLRNARIWASKPIKTSTIVNGDTAAKLLKLLFAQHFNIAAGGFSCCKVPRIIVHRHGASIRQPLSGGLVWLSAFPSEPSAALPVAACSNVLQQHAKA